MIIVPFSDGADQAPCGPVLAGTSPVGDPLGIHGGIVVGPTTDLRHLDAVSRRFQLQAISRSLLPDYSVSKCLRYMAGGLVEVYHHSEYNSASYSGLQTCGSVHVCPCCGSKITERRAREISSAISSWSERGGAVLMATFTLQHNADDTLQSLGSALNEAYRYMRSISSWRTFSARLGLVGSITAREYTHGSSGWHPHLHALLFVSPLSVKKAFKAQRWLRSVWASSVARFGRYAHPEIGVTCNLGDVKIADYITKQSRSWTLGDEMAKANRKLGRGKGRTPPQLLWDAGYGDTWAASLYQEYAAWTYRKNALVWSPGLRQLLGLVEEEKTDQEVAAELVVGGQLLVQFDRRQWRVILANDLRAEVLLVAAAGDVDRVVEFVAQFGIELHPPQLADLGHLDCPNFLGSHREAMGGG